MDDLLKIAGNVMENFNPETDSANDFENLPDGQYTGLIAEVNNRTSESGTKSVFLKIEIADGKYTGRLLFVNYYFTEKTTERSIKYILKLVHDLGFEQLSLDAFKSLEDLTNALESIVGTEVTVTQKTSKSGFANHEVALSE